MSIRQVMIFANPISGSGSAVVAAGRLQAALSLEEFSVEVIESTLPSVIAEAEEKISDADLVVVCGGDGSLMNLLPALARIQTPVYMFPSGNESLFAKEFGMTKSVHQLLAAASKPDIEYRHLALINDCLFFTMVSIGLDSCVIQRISKSRKSPIGHWGYVLPSLQLATGFSPPVITLSVDGTSVVENEPGYLIIGNTGQFALGAPFLPEAPLENGELAARFFPNAGLLSYLSWPLRTLLGLGINLEGSRFFRGLQFELSTNEPCPVQADGEYVGDTPVMLKAVAARIQVLGCRAGIR